MAKYKLIIVMSFSGTSNDLPLTETNDKKQQKRWYNVSAVRISLGRMSAV